MAAVRCNVPYPADDLQKTSDKTLWAQHHDAWITATTRSGRQAWAFQVAAQTMEAEEIGSAAIARSMETLSRGEAKKPSVPLGAQWFRVFNTSAVERDGTVEVNWGSDIGTRRARV